MPLYEYVCDSCGCKFERLRSVAAADQACECPTCHSALAHRVLSRFATLRGGGNGNGDSSSSSGSCASCSASSCAHCHH